ncbi:S4 domain-containing protein, partial [Acinetobacter baumannii]
MRTWRFRCSRPLASTPRRAHNNAMTDIESMRLDKWLWCARFYKTRSLATEEIGKGRVTANGALVKPAREV